MYAEIASALTSIKTFGDLTSLILKMKVDSAITEKAIESQSAIISLQTTMLALQSEYQSLLTEKAELERRLVNIEDWSTEARKYSLTQVSRNVFVYALNAEQDSATPVHWLCTRCYEERHKSILQRTARTGIGTAYLCPKCQNTLLVKE